MPSSHAELEAFARRVRSHGHGGARRLLVVGDPTAAEWLERQGFLVERADAPSLDDRADHSLDGIWLGPGRLDDVADPARLFDRAFHVLHHGFIRVPVSCDEAGRYRLELLLERAHLRVVEMHGGLIAWTKLVPPIFGAGAIVFDEAGRILLCDRADGRGWCIPGGVADADEPPAETAVRELREEVGLEVEIERFLGLYSGWNVFGRIVVAEFICRVVGGETRLSDETKGFGWFHQDELPRELIRMHHVRIADAFAVHRGEAQAPFVRDDPTPP